jgi:hypothetical protein
VKISKRADVPSKKSGPRDFAANKSRQDKRRRALEKGDEACTV